MLYEDEKIYLKYIKENKSLRTYSTYKSSLERYGDFIEFQMEHFFHFDDEGGKHIEINYRTINVDFPKYLLENYSKMTRKQALSIIQHLRIYFEWRDKKTGISLKTLLGYDKFADKLFKRHITKQYDVGHATVRRVVDHIHILPANPRNLSLQLAVLLIYKHGFTTNELLGFQKFSNKNGIIKMAGSSAPRKIILQEYIHKLWSTYCDTRFDDSNYLFPSFLANSDYDVREDQMSPRTLQKQFSRIKSDLKLKEFSPRMLRALFINTARETMTINELRLAMGWHKDYSGFYYSKVK